MDYRWTEIKDAIIKNCKRTFSEQGVPFVESKLHQSVDLFNSILSFPVCINSFQNLEKELKISLQRSFVDNVGSSIDLKSVLNSLDPYLKKVLYLAGMKTEAELSKKESNLKYLLGWTNASGSFSSISSRIDDTITESYRNDSTGAFIFCITYLNRNKVHESPNWDFEDVVVKLRYAVSTYILVTCHLSDVLLRKNPNLGAKKEIDLRDYSDSTYLYDFINYGSVTNQIKNQIVESFIVHKVFINPNIKTSVLASDVESFSHCTLSVSAVERTLKRMMPDKLEYADGLRTKLCLTNIEEARVRKILEEYSESLSRFRSDLSTILEQNQIFNKLDSVIDALKKLFEENCNAIVEAEASDKSQDVVMSDSTNEFIAFLVEIGCTEALKKSLFKQIMNICSLNDVLAKMSLAKTFSLMTNPDNFSNAIKSNERFIYLDTQVLLYALCIYDDFLPYSDSQRYVVVKSLIEIAKKNKRIHLIATNQYINEAAYHLKRAIQLIPFDDIYCDQRIKLSDNVFYNYYYYLKDTNSLNEGIECFADFLKELFDVSYDDIIHGKFEDSIYPSLVNILSDECGIQVENVPHYQDSELHESERIFSLYLNGDDRSPIATQKDALMGLLLFDSEKHPITEPVFLSWDKTFSGYRKAFMEQYRKHSPLSWLLFNPGRFVNHMDLCDLKINIDVLSGDLISIIEDSDTSVKTKSIVDSINKLLEKCNLPGRKQRRAITEIIFSNNDFSCKETDPDEKGIEKIRSFASAFDKLLSQMQSGDNRYANYSTLLTNEESLKSVIISLSEQLKQNTVDQSVKQTMQLISEMKMNKDYDEIES